MSAVLTVALWQRAVSLVTFVFLSNAVLLVFSDVYKVGHRVLDALLVHPQAPSALVGLFVLLFLVLYIADISYWPGRCGTICRRVAISALLVLLVAAGLLSTQPYVPLGVCMMSLPFAALFLSNTIFKGNEPADVARCLGQSFLAAGIIVFTLWVVWFGGGLHQNGVQDWFTKRSYFSELAQCNRVDKRGEFVALGRYTLGDGTVICLAAVLLWATPIILFGVLLFLGIFLLLLSRALRDGSSASKALRVLGFVVFVSFVGLYSSATVSGAGVGMARLAFAVYGIALISTVVTLAAIIGVDSLTTQVLEHPWIAKLSTLGDEALHFMHALGFFFGLVPFLAFLVVSALNQLVRRIDHVITCCQFAKGLHREEARRARLLTHVANCYLEYIVGWEWTAVLSYAQTIALVMWALNYGATLTYIVLNACIAALISVHWALVSLLFVAIGLVMFLIPVVPGTAVYLTGGVLLVPVCEAAWKGCTAGGGACGAPPPLPSNGTIGLGPLGDATSLARVRGALAALAEASAEASSPACSGLMSRPFWLAVAWACLLTQLLKFLAHVVQQKAFGEVLGSRVSVRTQVKPNTTTMKAIRLILEEPGLTLAKMCIMCGGPDWPVSVLCGILKLSVVQTSLGLLPIFLFTIPTVLAGAFQTKVIQPFANLDALALLVLMLMQLIFGLGMVYLTNQVVTKRADELAAIPDDEEVKKLDAASAATKAVKTEATRFATLPSWVRAVHVTATLLLMGSSYFLLFAPSILFQPFSLTDCRSDLGKRPHHAIPIIGASRFGAAALACLLVSIVLMKIFSIWASRATKQALARVTPSKGVA